MKTLYLLLILSVGSVANVFAATYGDRNVFFNHNSGTYWTSLINKDFGNISGLTDAEKQRQFITSSKQLRVKLLKNKLVAAGGVTSKIKIQKAQEYTLEYKVKFEPGFDWRRGGKIPGIGGGKVYTGCNKASAGDGWSFRVMWRKYTTVNDGKPFLQPYLYYKDMPKNCGHSFAKRYTITANQWYTVWIRAKMNTGNNNNGIVQMKVNGSTVFSNTSFKWVSKNSGREVDTMLWGIFRGGQGDPYISSEDSHLFIDNVKIDKK